MTYAKLIEIADRGYGNDKDYPMLTLFAAVDETGQERPNLGECDDTLAVFITRELRNTFDQDSDDAEQLQGAVGALELAVADLQRTIETLQSTATRKVG